MESHESNASAIERALERLVASFGEKRVTFAGYWAGAWLFLQLNAGLRWNLEGRSPLVWNTPFGVAEWVCWTAVTTLIGVAAWNQFFHELPGRNIRGDVRALCRYFLRGGCLLAFAVSCGLLRFATYASNKVSLPTHFWRNASERPWTTVGIGLFILLLFCFWPLLIFIIRVLAVFIRHGPRQG